MTGLNCNFSDNWILSPCPMSSSFSTEKKSSELVFPISFFCIFDLQIGKRPFFVQLSSTIQSPKASIHLSKSDRMACILSRLGWSNLQCSILFSFYSSLFPAILSLQQVQILPCNRQIFLPTFCNARKLILFCWQEAKERYTATLLPVHYRFQFEFRFEEFIVTKRESEQEKKTFLANDNGGSVG